MREDVRSIKKQQIDADAYCRDRSNAYNFNKWFVGRAGLLGAQASRLPPELLCFLLLEINYLA